MKLADSFAVENDPRAPLRSQSLSFSTEILSKSPEDRLLRMTEASAEEHESEGSGSVSEDAARLDTQGLSCHLLTSTKQISFPRNKTILHLHVKPFRD